MLPLSHPPEREPDSADAPAGPLPIGSNSVLGTNHMSWTGTWTSGVVTQHLWVPDHFPKMIFQALSLLLINASPEDYLTSLGSQELLPARARFSPIVLLKEDPSCPGSLLHKTTRGLLDIMLTFSSLCLWETQSALHLPPTPPSWAF